MKFEHVYARQGNPPLIITGEVNADGNVIDTVSGRYELMFEAENYQIWRGVRNVLAVKRTEAVKDGYAYFRILETQPYDREYQLLCERMFEGVLSAVDIMRTAEFYD